MGLQAIGVAAVSRISQLAVGPAAVDPPISRILVSPGSSTDVSVTPRPPECSFGPVLHVVRWRADALDRLLDDIAATGYGLTLGIQSRIDATIRRIVERLPTGNIYVNRNIIGAVVGTQPFGGSGLSGTGPKAGGPGYLRRFALEQVVSVNTTAVGGNASLLAEPA